MELEDVYSETQIRCFEFAFGKTFVSTGGEATNSEMLQKLDLKKGDKVLDVGSGIGGSAFYVAKKFGAKVHGVDYTSNMVLIANKYLAEMEPAIQENVSFEQNDIMDCVFDPNSFDAIYSRDSILHIGDKPKLFAKIFSWLKPGGKVFFTDICEGGRNPHSELYQKYISHYQLSILTIPAYKSVLEKVGFVDVEALDYTLEYLNIIRNELNRFESRKEEFLKTYKEANYDYISGFWQNKIDRFSVEDNAWGVFKATKRL